MKLHWCPKCEAPEHGALRLTPVRETKPHYQFAFYWLPYCDSCETQMTALCERCGKAPATCDDDCRTCAEKHYEPWQMEDFRRDQAQRRNAS